MCIYYMKFNTHFSSVYIYSVEISNITVIIKGAINILTEIQFTRSNNKSELNEVKV